jgi:hypothetical protein
MGGSPNEASATVLFELVAEEYAYNECEGEENTGYFEASVNEYHSEPQLSTEVFDDQLIDKNDEQDFTGAGGQYHCCLNPRIFKRMIFLLKWTHPGMRKAFAWRSAIHQHIM